MSGCDTGRDANARVWALGGRLVLAAALCLFAPPRTLAQGGSDDADAGVAEEPIIPYAASEIASAVNATTVSLAALELELEPSERVKGIESALPGLQERIAAQARAQTSWLGLRELEEARQTWRATEANLEDHQLQLASRAEKLEEVGRELTEMGARWEATRDVAPPLPPAALEQARRVLREINATRRHTDASLASTLAIQRSVAHVQLVVTGVLSRLDRAEADLRGQLVQRNRDLIFQYEPGEADRNPFVGLRGVQDSLSRFTRHGDTRLLYHLALCVLLLLTTRYISRHTTKSAPVSVKHPTAAAFFLALLASRFLHPYAPAFVRDLVLLATVPALAAILRTRAQRRILLYSVPFVLIDALRVLSHEASHWHRVTLLLSSCAGCIPLVVLLREARRKATESTPELTLTPHREGSVDWAVGRRARLLAGTALATLAVAVGANVLGYVTLAQLLSEATLSTVYLSGTLAALAEVLDAYATVGVRTPAALHLRSLQSRPEVVIDAARKVIRIACAALWTVLTLDEFRLWEPLVRALGESVDASWTVGTVTLSVGGVVTFVLAITLAYWASRFVGFVLDEDVLPRLNLGRGVAPTVSMLSRYTIVGVGLVLAVAGAGVELSNLAFIMGALGVGIGFGLQTIVSNFVAGLILIFERPIKIGDVIEVGTTLVGEVTHIGIRASTVRTRQGAEVIIPNAQLISNEVVNWTASDRHRRVDVDVGVAYGTDLRRVVTLLTEAAAGLEDALDFPPAMTVFTGFGESSVNFSVRIWIWEHDQWLQAKTELATVVAEALEAEGIEIPFPQQVVHRAEPREPKGKTPPPGEGDGDDDD